MVKLPVGTIDEPMMQAQPDAQPRAGSDRMLSFVGALLHAHLGTIERQGKEIADLREERGRLQAERDNALARAEKAEEDLNYLRIDLRREQEYAKERAAVLKARDQRIEEMEAELSALRAVPWWRRIFG